MLTREDIDDAIEQFLTHTKDKPDYACEIANALIATLYSYCYHGEEYEINYQPPKLVVNKSKE